MSLTKHGASPNNGTTASLEDMANRVEETRSDNGARFENPRHTDLVISSESYNPGSGQYNELVSVETALVASIEDIGKNVWKDGLTTAQKDAGVIIAAAFGNPSAYAKASFESTSSLAANAGSMSYDGEPAYSIESYDASSLKNHMTYSLVFNMAMVRATNLVNLFFKPVVQAPNSAGVRAEVQYTVVRNPKKHETDGSILKLNERRLIEATVDPTVLDESATELVPWYDPTNPASLENFVDSSVVAPWTTTVNGVEFQTSSLRLNKEINIVGLGQNPGEQGSGIADITDTLDRRLGIKRLKVRVSDGTNDEVISIPTRGVSRSVFQKSVEGNAREMTLNFHTEGLMIDSGTLTTDSTNSVVLSGLFGNSGAYQDYLIRLGVDISGRANLEFGTVKVGGSVEIDSIARLTNGKAITETDESVISAIKNALSVELVSVDIDARLTNSNRRRLGTLVDTVTVSENYNIYTTAPITTRRPEGVPTTADFTAPLSAANLRNNTSAVTAMIDYFEQLMAFNPNTLPMDVIPPIEGLGRYLVFPHVRDVPLDINLALNSTASSMRSQDIAATILNKINDEAYLMYERSNYGPALEQATGVTGLKPTLAIGTSPRLERHLFIQGDPRLGSVGFDVQHASATDIRLRDYIYLSFVRPNVEGIDALSFGNAIIQPELVTEVNTSRDGSHSRELMVQPRILHKCHLPLLVRIKVTGLEEVFETATQYDVS